MRALALAVLLSACAVGEPQESPASFRVTYDAGCEAPTADDREMLHRAAWLWLSWDIQVSEDIEGAPLTVCLVDGVVHDRYGGKAYGPNEQGRYAIIVNRTPTARQYYYGTIAHEIGHLVMAIPGVEDHLPPEQRGIMSSTLSCQDDTLPFDCHWSADDIAHLESFGLVRGDDA